MRRRMVFISAAGLLLLLAFVLLPNPNRPFARHVYSPVPGSVRVISFQSNDWLAAHPEPVCYLAFTASPDDLGTVIQKGRFQPTSSDDVPVPSGPAGWVTAREIGAGGRVFRRSHSSSGPVWLRWLGNKRSWTEFLWIDGTGTNAYFLLWGV